MRLSDNNNQEVDPNPLLKSYEYSSLDQVIVEIIPTTLQDQEERDLKNEIKLYTKSSSSNSNLWKSKSYRSSLLALLCLGVISTLFIIALIKSNLPSLDPNDQVSIKFPRNFEDLRQLNTIFSVYIDQNFTDVYVTYLIIYIYLQSFSLPGSMWLSILGGALFPFWIALLTVALCSAIGSSFAYIISGSLASIIVKKRIGDRTNLWKSKIMDHKKDIFNYIIVLKLAPLPPNWLINISAPHLHIPLGALFWGTFLGVIPPSFIHVQAGAALDKIASSEELHLMTPTNILCLVGVGIAALLPVYIRKRYNL